jgi:hypothetical protein
MRDLLKRQKYSRFAQQGHGVNARAGHEERQIDAAVVMVMELVRR